MHLARCLQDYIADMLALSPVGKQTMGITVGAAVTTAAATDSGPCLSIHRTCLILLPQESAFPQAESAAAVAAGSWATSPVVVPAALPLAVHSVESQREVD